MSEVLKPCPFGCNRDTDNLLFGLSYEDSVECPSCGCRQPYDHWNTRPIEDALRERVEELEAELRQTEESFHDAVDQLYAAEAKLARVKEWLEAYDHTAGYPPTEALDTLSDTRKPLAVVEGYAPKKDWPFPWVHHAHDEYDEYPRYINVEEVGEYIGGSVPVTVIVMPRESEGE